MSGLETASAKVESKALTVSTKARNPLAHWLIRHTANQLIETVNSMVAKLLSVARTGEDLNNKTRFPGEKKMTNSANTLRGIMLADLKGIMITDLKGILVGDCKGILVSD